VETVALGLQWGAENLKSNHCHPQLSSSVLRHDAQRDAPRDSFSENMYKTCFFKINQNFTSESKLGHRIYVGGNGIKSDSFNLLLDSTQCRFRFRPYQSLQNANEEPRITLFKTMNEMKRRIERRNPVNERKIQPYVYEKSGN
jgi:hypothetical protein